MTNAPDTNKPDLTTLLKGIKNPTLGDLIRVHREAKGLSRAKLAKKTNINENSISKYEKAGMDGGQFPSAPKLAALCAVLDIGSSFAMFLSLPKEQQREFGGFFIVRPYLGDAGNEFEAGSVEEFMDARRNLEKGFLKELADIRRDVDASHLKMEVDHNEAERLNKESEALRTEMKAMLIELKNLKENGPEQK